MSQPRRPLVEILYFDGCPNHKPALALVERVDRELKTNAEFRLINVPDQTTAERLHFLGSPTIRVDGVDVDPHIEQRTDYALSCRLFTTEHGRAGRPDERWIRDALASAAKSERDGVERVLEAAAIPRSRCGTERTARLSREERQLYGSSGASQRRRDQPRRNSPNSVHNVSPLRRCARSTHSESRPCSTNRSKSTRTTRSPDTGSGCASEPGRVSRSVRAEGWRLFSGSR